MSCPPSSGRFADLSDAFRRLREVAGRAVDRGYRVSYARFDNAPRWVGEWSAADVAVPAPRPFLSSSRATEIGNALHAEIERYLARSKP